MRRIDLDRDRVAALLASPELRQEDIARTLGISTATLSKFIHAAGLPARPKGKIPRTYAEHEPAIASAHAAGDTQRTVARRLGITIGAVILIERRLGLLRRRGRRKGRRP